MSGSKSELDEPQLSDVRTLFRNQRVTPYSVTGRSPFLTPLSY